MKYMMAAGWSLLMVVGSAASQALFIEGEHYTPLETPVAVADPSMIEVVEIFSYGCPHCYEFEHVLGPWSKELADDVYLKRMPAALGHQFFAQMSAAYYASKHFGVHDLMHDRIFEEIHDNRNRAIAGFDGMAAFFDQFGVPGDELEAYLRSEELAKIFSEGETALRVYPLTGVPTVIVNGKYHVNRNPHVTSYEQMLEVIDYLVDLERAAEG